MMKNLARRFLQRTTSEHVEVETEEDRPCPHCGESVSRGATVCLHCEREIMPLMSYSEFALKFGSPHSGGPPHGVKGQVAKDDSST